MQCILSRLLLGGEGDDDEYPHHDDEDTESNLVCELHVLTP